MKRVKVGIIGGGAAGMMAAITAATEGAEVTLLERGERLGKKLLSTGNGKCNLGNLYQDMSMYYSGDKGFAERALRKFDVHDTIGFFNGLGLLLKNKNGYLYPACEQASAVLDVLRNEIKTLEITVIPEVKINHISKKKDLICLSDGSRDWEFDRVIIACGSKAAPKTGSDGSGYKLAKQIGHSLVPSVPALVQLKCREEYMKSVAGVRAEGEICVYLDGKSYLVESGEIQLTDYGISGIPVFQVSREVNYILREREEVEVVLNLLPDYDNDSFEQMIAGRKLLQTGRTVEEFFTGVLNKKIMSLFIRMVGLKPNLCVEEADEAAIRQVYDLCRNWKLHINGSNSYDNAQVCAGGVNLSEVEDTMESKKMSGIFFAGEILDVDGKCGGYNLQWAWTSGYLAGKAAAER